MSPPPPAGPLGDVWNRDEEWARAAPPDPDAPCSAALRLSVSDRRASSGERSGSKAAEGFLCCCCARSAAIGDSGCCCSSAAAAAASMLPALLLLFPPPMAAAAPGDRGDLGGGGGSPAVAAVAAAVVSGGSGAERLGLRRCAGGVSVIDSRAARRSSRRRVDAMSSASCRFE